MKKIIYSKLMIIVFSLLLFSCSSEDENYKSFSGPQEAFLFNENSSVLETIQGETTFTELLVSSTTVSNVDRNVEIFIDPASTALPSQYSIDYSTAVIPAGSTTAKIKINAGDFASLPVVGSNKLFFTLDPDLYVLPNRNIHTLSIQRGCNQTKVDFFIDFDAYGSETGWILSNASGIIESAGAGSYTDGQASYSRQFCLSPGAYTFEMTDIYGDGLFTSASNTGFFTLKLTDGTVLVTAGGNFGFSTGPLTFTIN
jgi:hypothetical protein